MNSVLKDLFIKMNLINKVLYLQATSPLRKMKILKMLVISSKGKIQWL